MTSLVLIVGGARAHQEGLAEALKHRGQVKSVESVATIDAALERLRETQPDLLLLDVADIDAPSGTRMLVSAAPEVPVVAFGVTESESEIVALAEAGVSGYVPRQASLEDLFEEIEMVAHGQLRASPEVAGFLLRRVRSLATELPAVGTSLTGRQLQILRLIEEGYSNKDIARRLSISLQTVKNHVHNILGELELHSRAEAAAWARRQLFGKKRDETLRH